MADVIFQGTQPDVRQVDTVTVANTWATSDTGTLTIGGADLTFTVGSDTATTDIAEILRRMVNGEDLKNDESRTITGNLVGQFANLTATSSGSVCTLTADRINGDSEPFTLTVSESTAGTGVLTQATSTSHTGPYDANQAKNYDTGAVPTGTDNLIVATPGTHIRWNLQSLAAGVSIIKHARMDGHIGLPLVNNSASGLPYREYRPRKLRIQGATVTLETGVGPGSPLLNIDCNAGSAATITIFRSGVPLESGRPAIQLENLDALSTLEQLGGSVGVDIDDDDTNSGAFSWYQAGGDAVLGNGTTLTDYELRNGGVMRSFGNLGNNSIHFVSGTVISEPLASMTAAPTVEKGAVLDYRGAALAGGSLNLRGGKLDLSSNPNSSVSAAAIECYGEGSEICDPRGLLAADTCNIDLNHIGIEALEVCQLGTNIRLALTSL